MEFKDTKYFRVGRADELTGSDRIIYRLLEIFPGFLTWLTIFLMFFCSFYFPFQTSVFILLFDIYWLLKTLYLSIYLYQSWSKTKHNLSLDWNLRLSLLKYDHLYQMVMLPFYKEPFEVVEKSLDSLLTTNWDKKKMIVVLASEEKDGKHGETICAMAREKYADKFAHFFCTTHPANVFGEIAGKGSNIAYSAELVGKEILNKNSIKFEDVLISAFDIDTVVEKDYFNCLTWNFLTVEDRFRSSFQPIPIFNNNFWSTPAFSKIMSATSSFWQMIQQERPDKIDTFSSHSMSFKTLDEIKYWQKNMVSEDSRIFWNAFLAFDGNYKTVPMFYPVFMDANLAETFWQTAKNVYKQQRRWAWGVENLPYMYFGFIKNKNISIFKKVFHTLVSLEKAWSRTTNSLMILFLGWLPVLIGGKEFNSHLISYNLPVVSRVLMTIVMLGLVLSVYISFGFIPKREGKKDILAKIVFALQWLLTPVLLIVFGSIPAIDSQTRLMFGKYMGFWVTPKNIIKK
jgi:hypothetical protein